MKHSPVEKEVLGELEKLFTEEALTADKVASAMDYLKENYKKVGIYDVLRYAYVINRHFGYLLITGPFGTTSRSGNECVDSLSFILDVDNLLILNQRGQPSLLDKILKQVIPEREEKINNNITRFCKGFYTDMKGFDWESRNMKYAHNGLEVKVKETTTITQVTTKEF